MFDSEFLRYNNLLSFEALVKMVTLRFASPPRNPRGERGMAFNLFNLVQLPPSLPQSLGGGEKELYKNLIILVG